MVSTNEKTILMKKTCYNCEHYFDMCACEGVEDIECILIGMSILKRDYRFYFEIKDVVRENCGLAEEGVAENVDYDKIKAKLKGQICEKINTKMIRKLMRHIGSVVAANCDYWDYCGR